MHIHAPPRAGLHMIISVCCASHGGAPRPPRCGRPPPAVAAGAAAAAVAEFALVATIYCAWRHLAP
eukprot:352800-Chlamydomonas_euryale.AAC.20